VQPARKSRWVAALLAGLIPGLGHIYLGQYPKGMLYMAGAGGLTFFGLDLDLTVIGAAMGVPMELGALALWAHGVLDAYRTAQRMEAEAYKVGLPGLSR
jgi:TM2 domain-containing membrane protein YozV